MAPGHKKRPELAEPKTKRRSGVQPRKRRHSRFEIAAPLHVRISAGGDANAFEGFCDNLSLGGMFITTLTMPAQGTGVRVWLKLPSGEEILLTGTVQWTTDKGMGVQHSLLGARDTFLLTEYLASLPKPADDDDASLPTEQPEDPPSKG